MDYSRRSHSKSGIGLTSTSLKAQEFYVQYYKYIDYNEYSNGLKYEVLCLIYSDSFIIETLENLYNSLFLPRNEIISKGSKYTRCSQHDAEIILRDMDNSYIISRLDNLCIEDKSSIMMSLLCM